MPKISLCMIVRNEAALIESCLCSVRDYVDEMIVVDTGSTDGSREIASACGAKVFSFEWVNDFSKARNFSIEQAQSDWILVLDADERISERHLKRLSELTKIKEARAFAFISRNYLTNPKAAGFKPCRGEYVEELKYPGYFENSKAVMFRNDPSIRFQGVVHENVLESVKGDLYDGEIIIHHYGHVISEARNQAKRRQYIELGEHKIKSSPRDPDSHYELGLEYQTQGDFASAQKCFQIAYDLDSSRIEIASALSSVLFRSGTLNEAQKICEQILILNPESEEALTRLGTIAMRGSQWSLALSYYDRVLKINADSFTALRNAALCLCELKQHQDAKPLFERALRIAPHFSDLRFEYAACLIQTGEFDKAQQINQENLTLFKNEDRFVGIQKTLQALSTR